MPKRQRKQQRPKGAKRLGFNRRVLSVINSQRELKVSPPLEISTPVGGPINLATPGTILNVFPDILNGSTEFTRIGNQILLKKLVFRGYYMIDFPINTNENARVLLRHMLVRQRNAESADSVINIPTTFFQNGILEPASPYNGAIADYLTPLNKSAFISKKQFKRVMTGPTNSGGVLQDTGGIDKSYHMFNYTLTFGKGKTLHYNTTGATAPNDFPYFLMNTCAPLGSPALVLPNPELHMVVTAYFYDS